MCAAMQQFFKAALHAPLRSPQQPRSSPAAGPQAAQLTALDNLHAAAHARRRQHARRLDAIADQGPHGDALRRQLLHHRAAHAAGGTCDQNLHALRRREMRQK